MAKPTNSLPVWRLRAKLDKRFKQGHPWVYSNELQESPKGIEPGEWVELHDASGNFLARGFGNPNSLIAFRALTRNKSEDPTTPEFFLQKLNLALEFRLRWFSRQDSFRMVFGDAEGLPGLVIDRYQGKSDTVYVVQAHSAGMDRN